MAKSPQQVYEAFRISMLAKNDDWKNMLAENVALTGPLAAVKGKAAFIEVNTPFFSSITNSQLHTLVASGHQIITQITTGVATPDGMGLDLKVSEWYEIDNGLIQSLTVYFDTAEFRKRIMGV